MSMAADRGGCLSASRLVSALLDPAPQIHPRVQTDSKGTLAWPTYAGRAFFLLAPTEVAGIEAVIGVERAF